MVCVDLPSLLSAQTDIEHPTSIPFFVYDKPDLISAKIRTSRDWFERETLELFLQLSHKFMYPNWVRGEDLYDNMFIDVGAHIGTYSVFVATHIPSFKHVMAFEPYEESFKILKANAAAHPAITCHQVAVGEYNGQCAMMQRASDNYGMAVAVQGFGTVMCTLDSALAATVVCGLRPAVIKIDVEGLELSVLRGASEILTTYRPMLIVETLTIHAFTAIMQFLSPMGYLCYTASSKSDPCAIFVHRQYV